MPANSSAPPLIADGIRLVIYMLECGTVESSHCHHIREKMTIFKLIAAAMIGACSIASAQDVVLIGHVQRIVLHPLGTENCPPPCPAVAKVNPDGSQSVCISNAGGCQTMEVAVDKFYRGGAGEAVRVFRSRIGEWGPSFPLTEKQIVVSEEAGNVSWSLATIRDGRIFIDPKSLRRVGGVPTSATNKGDLVALDDVLAVSGGHR